MQRRMRNLKDLTFQRREEADWTHRKPDQMPAVKKKCIPKTKFSFFWGGIDTEFSGRKKQKH